MPIQGYGVLKGRLVDARREQGTDSPHYQMRITAGATSYRIAVNVMSQEKPSDLLFLVNDNFRHPLTDALAVVQDTFTPIPNKPGGSAVDFIRGNLFDRTEMRTLPPNLPGPDNDLADRVEHFAQRAIQDASARVFAFGQRWGPETKADTVFGFKPGNGVHDIHMNQGNSAKFQGDDGVWQDGALLFHFPSPEQWVAIFLAFQSQAWHTDDVHGHAIAGPPAPTPTPTPAPVPTDHIVRIVAAMVNPAGPAPERETVTLLNTTSKPVALTGWQVADQLKHRQTLSGQIAAGQTRIVNVAPPVQLSNQGGIITLLDAHGLKVDGVSYTKAQAQREGTTIKF
jgi:uncharacterized protein YukJ